MRGLALGTTTGATSTCTCTWTRPWSHQYCRLYRPGRTVLGALRSSRRQRSRAAPMMPQNGEAPEFCYSEPANTCQDSTEWSGTTALFLWAKNTCPERTRPIPEFFPIGGIGHFCCTGVNKFTVTSLRWTLLFWNLSALPFWALLYFQISLHLLSREMCDFRKWSEDWWDDTEITLTLWISKTVLKTMSADWDKKELFSTNQGTPNESFKERILVNDRCGNQYVQGQTGETQEVNFTICCGWRHPVSQLFWHQKVTSTTIDYQVFCCIFSNHRFIKPVRTALLGCDFCSFYQLPGNVKTSQVQQNFFLFLHATTNYACSLLFLKGELTNGQTYTITETAGWSQSFSFGFSVSYEAGVDIKMISNTMSMTSEMSYESSKDFEKAVTKSETSTYKWPDYCNPGFECKTTLYITRNVVCFLPHWFSLWPAQVFYSVWLGFKITYMVSLL